MNICNVKFISFSYFFYEACSNWFIFPCVSMRRNVMFGQGSEMDRGRKTDCHDKFARLSGPSFVSSSSVIFCIYSSNFAI